MATPKKTAAGTWHIQFEIKGVRESGTFPTKREAQEWALSRSQALRAAAEGRVSEIKTLGDALRRYMLEVTPDKRGALKEQIRLQAFLKQPAFPYKKKLAEVTASDIAQWRDARLKVNARGSVLRDMTLLSSVFDVARRDWGWLRQNPMAEVRRPAEPDHRERVIAFWEVRRMLRALGWGRAKPVRSVSQAVAGCFLLALQTGMRAGEICALRWEDVQADYCVLHSSKTGKGRHVPLAPTSRRTIELMAGWDAESVFGLRPQGLDAMFRKYREKAGLAGFTFHDSRHTAATRLAQRLHVLDLCKMFGWTTTTRALTYYNPTASDIALRLTGAAAGTPVPTQRLR